MDINLEVVVMPVAAARGQLAGRSFGAFRDPDDNGWLLQEFTTRLAGPDWHAVYMVAEQAGTELAR